MYSSEAGIPMSQATLRKTLDSAVDDRCQRFYEAFRKSEPFGLDAETGEPLPADSDAMEEALLELAFICDARAQADNDQYSIVNNVSWAQPARMGFRRLARRGETLTGMDKLRIFIGRDVAMQAGTYVDMAARRVAPEGQGVRQCTGPQYAARVAMGEVVLEEKPSPVS